MTEYTEDDFRRAEPVDPEGESADDAALRWMIRAKEEQGRAEKAEKERDGWERIARAVKADLDDAEQPRGFTADDIERGVPRLRTALDYDMSALMAHEVVKEIVDAVLTPRPARDPQVESLVEDITRWDDTIAQDGPCDATWDSLAGHLIADGWTKGGQR